MNSTVADVMTRSVVAVRETAGYKDIVKVMRRRRVSAFPVLDSADHVVGVVSEADLLLKEAVVASASTGTVPPWAAGREKERAKATGVAAAELMTRPAVTIGPDATVAAAARLMYSRHVKRLPVVDATGRLVGIVSRVDVLSVFGRPDEQIRAEAIEVIGGVSRTRPRHLRRDREIRHRDDHGASRAPGRGSSAARGRQVRRGRGGCARPAQLSARRCAEDRRNHLTGQHGAVAWPG